MITEEQRQQLKEDAQAAYDILSDRSRWTRSHFARDQMGALTTPCSTQAVCWCAWGVTEKVCGMYGRRLERLQSALAWRLGASSMMSVANVNDHSTNGYELVLEAFKKIAEGA